MSSVSDSQLQHLKLHHSQVVQNCKLYTHKIENKTEQLHLQAICLAKLNDEHIKMTVILAMQEEQVSCIKKIILSKMEVFQEEKIILDKCQCAVWLQREYLEKKLNVMYQNGELEEDVFDQNITIKHIDPNFHADVLKIYGQLNALKFYIKYSTELIAKMVLQITDLASEKDLLMQKRKSR